MLSKRSAGSGETQFSRITSMVTGSPGAASESRTRRSKGLLVSSS
jgi:hypothetical protein